MPQKIYQVDAFTDRAFAGNPAGVVPLAAAVDAAWMQAFATEMNLSETAYVWPAGEGFHLRWFTPACEVRLCGHATLASAHLLWEIGAAPVDRALSFETLSGRLTCRRRDDGAVEMDFPARPPSPVAVPDGLERALGSTVVACSGSEEDLLVRVGDAATVRGLAVDTGAVAELPVRGVIVTAPGDDGSGADFVSRFFAPRFGIAEDPVTGSAHCVLAPYWARELGRDALVGHQISPRGGRVEATWEGERVRLAGQAVTVFRAELSDTAAPPA